jgi:hypothetical protein
MFDVPSDKNIVECLVDVGVIQGIKKPDLIQKVA